MIQKAGEDLFFLVFTSSLVGVFVKLKPPLKISRSATGFHRLIFHYHYVSLENLMTLLRSHFGWQKYPFQLKLLMLLVDRPSKLLIVQRLCVVLEL